MSARQRGVSPRWGERTENTAEDTPAGRACAASALGLLGSLGLLALALMCWRTIAVARPVGQLGEHLEVSLALHLVVLGAAGLTSLWLAAILLIGSAATMPGRLLAPLRAVAHGLAPRLAPRLAAALVTATVSLVPLGTANAQEPAPVDSAAVVAPVAGGVGEASQALVSGSPAPESGTQTPESGRLAPESGPLAPESGPLASESAPQAPEPGWAPTAPPNRQDPGSISLVSRGGAGPDSVVVRAGDTLWDVAARHLGPDADPSEIAAAWPRWHEANRAAIGPDPDLILPGTELVPPAAAERAGARR